MEKISALPAFCAENSLVTGEFPTQRPVKRSFDVFFDLRQRQQLNKQRRRRWFEKHRFHKNVIVLSQNRRMWLNILIYLLITFSHHFDWDKDHTHSQYGAFYPKVIPMAKWNMICWGKMAILWVKMEQIYGAKWHILTNACASNLLGGLWWRQFDMFSAKRVRNVWF